MGGKFDFFAKASIVASYIWKGPTAKINPREIFQDQEVQKQKVFADWIFYLLPSSIIFVDYTTTQSILFVIIQGKFIATKHL